MVSVLKASVEPARWWSQDVETNGVSSKVEACREDEDQNTNQTELH